HPLRSTSARNQAKHPAKTATFPCQGAAATMLFLSGESRRHERGRRRRRALQRELTARTLRQKDWQTWWFKDRHDPHWRESGGWRRSAILATEGANPHRRKSLAARGQSLR